MLHVLSLIALRLQILVADFIEEDKSDLGQANRIAVTLETLENVSDSEYLRRDIQSLITATSVLISAYYYPTESPQRDKEALKLEAHGLARVTESLAAWLVR